MLVMDMLIKCFTTGTSQVGIRAHPIVRQLSVCLLSLQPAEPHSTSSWLSLLTLEYYQGFFDVTTAPVHRSPPIA